MNDIVGGPLVVAVPIAVLAGLLSFLSPCILPLVPGYLGYVGGMTGAGGQPDRRRLVIGVLLFILGFTLVFTLLSGAFGVVGQWLYVYRDVITRVAGALVIVLGLVFVGQFSFLQRTIKPGWLPRTGLAGATLLGIIFGVGWVPCISPTLGAIYALSLDSASAATGVVLGVAYSLGLGIPFLVIAFGFSWAATSVSWVRKHIRIINIIGGALLVVIGLLMVSGIWSLFMSALGAVINSYVVPL